jgi:hypothetical protein
VQQGVLGPFFPTLGVDMRVRIKAEGETGLDR